MTLDRLRALLDTWGAAPERWPGDERAAALALLGRSAEARALRDRAARLDALLDADPADAPSEALVTRVLAGAPVARPARVVRPARWLVPLALAAGLAVWLTRTVEPPPASMPIAALGVYEVGSDTLLADSDVALTDDDAWAGCPDDVLDCPVLPSAATDPRSRPSDAEGRTYS